MWVYGDGVLINLDMFSTIDKQHKSNGKIYIIARGSYTNSILEAFDREEDATQFIERLRVRMNREKK